MKTKNDQDLSVTFLMLSFLNGALSLDNDTKIKTEWPFRCRERITERQQLRIHAASTSARTSSACLLGLRIECGQPVRWWWVSRHNFVSKRSRAWKISTDPHVRTV
jgi:hypothetical protein